MKLYIAGGCGEHGRNCFHVTGESIDFLVDCGLMAAENDNYPRLMPHQIPKIQTVFLTHSHADHTGALPWLYENGFCGDVIASEHTIAQLPLKPKKAVTLESVCACGQEGIYRSMKIKWEKSGHCLGSVWYRFEAEGKSILFSGDYAECSSVYRVDPIRNQRADLAVLDCAYGKSTAAYSDACTELLRMVGRLLEKHMAVVMPVPKCGRGLDIISLLKSGRITAQCYADVRLLGQLKNMQNLPQWYYTDAESLSESVQPYYKGAGGIVLVSDPQLRSLEAFKTAVEVIKNGGVGLMTGTVDKGTNSEALIKMGKMLICRYPVHMNYSQYNNLARKNQFAVTIPYHSSEMKCDKSVFVI